MNGTGGGPRWVGPLAIVAALLVLIAGPLIRLGIVGWQLGLAMFAIAAVVAGFAGLWSLWQLVRRRGGSLTVLAAAAGLAGAVVPLAIVVDAAGTPPINDIATDTADPPAFVAITPALRGPDTAPVTYDPAFASQQQRAYPRLQPLVLAQPPGAAFQMALAAARDWDIVAADAASGRIEAAATVPWWGFKDDVVIRIRPQGTGSRVDVRSKSRVGEGDLGVNAQRIDSYLDRLAKAARKARA